MDGARQTSSGQVGRTTLHWSLPINYAALSSLVVGVDACLLPLASLLASIGYHTISWGKIGPIDQPIGLGVLTAAVLLPWLQVKGLYQVDSLLNSRRQFANVCMAWLSVFLFLSFVAYLFKVGDSFSRGATLAFFVAGFSVLLSHRRLWQLVLREYSSVMFKPTHAVLVTTKGEGRAASVIGQLKRRGYNIVKSFEVESDQSRWERTCIEVCNFARNMSVTQVIIAGDLKEIDRLTVVFRKFPFSVYVVRFDLNWIWSRPAERIGSGVMFEILRPPLTVIERASKRVVDVALASVGLALCVPIFAFVALAIAIDSPGPVFFRQRRLGFNGRPFHIWKFRSMRVQEDGDIVKACTRGDARVTRVGAIIRRLSLDELPQLVNVLAGDMSLVGPRPHAVAHDTLYDEQLSTYACRQKMKPGITGWAQVNGQRGEASTLQQMATRIQLDLQYIENWSLALDLRILLKTIVEVPFSRTAY